jgi:hypothetical protein
MKFSNLARHGLVASITLTALVACQGSDVSAPARVGPTTAASLARSQFSAPRGQGFAGNMNNDFQAARCTDRQVTSSAGVFGPAGGTLTFGDSRLIIPGGALTDTVTISATIVDQTTSRVEFQPHGLQFAKPAGLLLSTEGCVLSPDEAPSVVYLSQDGLVLETIDAVYDPHWKTFAAPIHHFSGYAIAF